MNNTIAEAVVEQNAMVIRIPLSVLKFATEHHPDFWTGERDDGDLKVTDLNAWAEEMAAELNHELNESGLTLITQMLDQAILNAVESGALAVDDVSG